MYSKGELIVDSHSEMLASRQILDPTGDVICVVAECDADALLSHLNRE